MTTPARPTQLAPEIEPIVLAVLESRVKEAKAAARVPLGPLYTDGDKRVIRSPLDDRKLGTVYRSDPNPTWRVTDRAALTAHLMDDPANVEYVDELTVTGPALLAVLAEVLPAEVLAGLLARVERVSEAAIAQALATARAGGDVAPGIERVKPEGTLSVLPDKQAGAAIEALVAAGWITYDGQPLALPAAPPAPDPSPGGYCAFCGTRVHDNERAAIDAQSRYGHADCIAVAKAKAAAEVEEWVQDATAEGVASADVDGQVHA